MAAAGKAGPAAMTEAVQGDDEMGPDRDHDRRHRPLLISGHYMASERWDFSDFFVNWGNIVILVILSG